MKNLNFIHIFSTITIIFIFLVYIYHKETHNTAMDNAYNKIDDILLNYKAFRTYSSKIQKVEMYKMQSLGYIDDDYFNPALLSSTFGVRNINKYYNEYRQEKNEEPILIKFASDNPRNKKNIINKDELLILNNFRENKIKKYSKVIENNGNTILYYAIPTTRTTKKCMKCHSKPSFAPKNLIEQYGDKNGFYEKEGNIRAIMSTQYPLNKDLENANKIFINLTLITFISFAILLLIIYFFMKRLENLNHILDDKVIKKTKELNNLNSQLEVKIMQEVDKNRQKDKHMIEQSRLAQMGEMISMIAHQWRQPLAAISSTAGTLILKSRLNTVDKETTLELAKDIAEYSNHLSSTINDFRDFFKSNKEKQNISYDNLIKDVLNIVEVSIGNKDIIIIKDLNSKLIFNTYSNEIKQVLLNLIKNAEDVLIEKEIINPTITIATNDNVLSISDNGGGIPENIMNKIFDPYFSTKINKDGTGLGLYMSKTIIEDHCGGKLSVLNGEDGAEFTIKLGKNNV